MTLINNSYICYATLLTALYGNPPNLFCIKRFRPMRVANCQGNSSYTTKVFITKNILFNCFHLSMYLTIDLSLYLFVNLSISLSIPIIHTYTPQGTVDNNLGSDRLAGPKALYPIPNYCRQPTLWLYDLCLEVLTVHGNELRLSRIWHSSSRYNC